MAKFVYTGIRDGKHVFSKVKFDKANLAANAELDIIISNEVALISS